MNGSQVEWLIALWLTALGGFIGSFLNVVVYRLPAGMSVVAPRSRCPACKHPIRWFDNVPVLSWIVLRGRCRDCQAPISPRYPLVEAMTAGMFLLLAIGEFLSGGGNLPLASPPSPAQLLGIYAYHLVLLCTLLAAALIQYDGHRPPARLFLPAAVVGLAAPCFGPCCTRWPHGTPSPWRDRWLGSSMASPAWRPGPSWAGWPADAAAMRDCAGARLARGCFSAGRRPAGWPRQPRPYIGCSGQRHATDPTSAVSPRPPG